MRLQSPINLHTPVQFSGRLPESADVCIVGAGIIGMSTALYLAEQGVRVVVCEKGRVGGEQSSRNWGWVRQTGRDADELPLMIEAIRLWQEMAARTGENELIFSEQGVMYLATDAAQLADYEAFAALARQHGLESKLLSGEQIAKQIPGATRRWQGALYTPSDGRVEPWYAVPAIARAAVRAGARVIENCAVRSISRNGGALSGVMTEQGPVSVERVLLAGGVWSSLLARQAGIDFPQLAVKATVARIDNLAADICPVNASDGRLALCRRIDGGYNIALADHHDYFLGPDSLRYLRPFWQGLMKTWRKTRFRLAAPAGYPDSWRTPRHWAADQQSPFEQTRVLDPQADPAIVQRMIARFHERFGGHESLGVSHAWAGMIDTTPDFVPILDQVASLPGLFIATGFSGHGFGIGPAAGRLMADLMQGRPPGHDIARFRLQRFSDGSPLRLGPI